MAATSKRLAQSHHVQKAAPQCACGHSSVTTLQTKMSCAPDRSLSLAAALFEMARRRRLQ
jgi:hypothetical protein